MQKTVKMDHMTYLPSGIAIILPAFAEVNVAVKHCTKPTGLVSTTAFYFSKLANLRV